MFGIKTKNDYNYEIDSLVANAREIESATTSDSNGMKIEEWLI